MDASKIPDRSVLKAVVVKSDLVSFSDYQQQVNAAAEKICLRTPHMICKCGMLLDLARKRSMIVAMCTRKGNLGPKRLAHVKTHQKGKSLIATIHSEG